MFHVYFGAFGFVAYAIAGDEAEYLSVVYRVRVWFERVVHPSDRLNSAYATITSELTPENLTPQSSHQLRNCRMA